MGPEGSVGVGSPQGQWTGSPRPEPGSPGLDGAPPEVREFLGRVLEELSEGGEAVTGYQFRHWEREGKPTHEAIGIKAIEGVDPREVIARVMHVDGYEAHMAHVEACRSLRDAAHETPERVHFFQRVSVPGIAKVQQELVLVDAGTLEGYRVAYWYLLKPETEALDPKTGAAQRVQRRGVAGSPWSGRLRSEYLAKAGRRERAAMGLVDLRRRWLGEESRRGQHRRHSGVGEGEAWGRVGPSMISCSVDPAPELVRPPDSSRNQAIGTSLEFMRGNTGVQDR